MLSQNDLLHLLEKEKKNCAPQFCGAGCEDAKAQRACPPWRVGRLVFPNLHSSLSVGHSILKETRNKRRETRSERQKKQNSKPHRRHIEMTHVWIFDLCCMSDNQINSFAAYLLCERKKIRRGGRGKPPRWNSAGQVSAATGRPQSCFQILEP